ncbi:MAG: hypothetical protein ACR2MM_08525 [Flavobacteriaceae bacterium]
MILRKLVFGIFTIGTLLIANAGCKGLSDSKPERNPTDMEQNDNQDNENSEIPAESEKPAEIMVRQRVSGGLIPTEREWIFYSNGEIRHPNGEVTTLDDEERLFLLESSELKSLGDLDTVYSAPSGSADYRTLELVLYMDDKAKNFIMEDTNDQIPDAIWDYWDRLQEAAKMSLAKK